MTLCETFTEDNDGRRIDGVSFSYGIVSVFKGGAEAASIAKSLLLSHSSITPTAAWIPFVGHIQDTHVPRVSLPKLPGGAINPNGDVERISKYDFDMG